MKSVRTRTRREVLITNGKSATSHCGKNTILFKNSKFIFRFLAPKVKLIFCKWIFQNKIFEPKLKFCRSVNFFYSDKLHQIRSSCVAPQQRRRDDVTLFEFHAFYTQSSVVLFFLLHFDHEKRIAELLWTFSVLIDVFWFWWYVGVHLHLLINMTFDKRVLECTLWQTVNFCSKIYFLKSVNYLKFHTKNS